MSQFPGGGPDFILPGRPGYKAERIREKMRDWLESEVKSAEEKWGECRQSGYSRGYWEGIASALDTFEAICEGKQ
jgi:hypothetical protein